MLLNVRSRNVNMGMICTFKCNHQNKSPTFVTSKGKVNVGEVHTAHTEYIFAVKILRKKIPSTFPISMTYPWSYLDCNSTK